MSLDIDIAILSLFCAGGLFAYVREVLRLRRLILSGASAVATIVDTREDNAGSESVTHYFVKYEFTDSEGQRRIHEQDLNNRRFFNSLMPGDKFEVLYEPVTDGNSYPVSQVNADIRVSGLISGAIILFWVLMAAYFAVY